ncbi:MAG: DNA-binding protein WhiA [Eubacterium sp.]|nr:DNA-binding protein WhiA [Eubacterium sp.]
MSFSSDLKNELAEINPHAQHCRIAELSALISLLGKYFDEKIMIRTENEVVFNKICRLVRKTFDNAEEMMYTSMSSGTNILWISGNLKNDVFLTLKLREEDGVLTAGNEVTQKTCCKRAYIRGTFLAVGSMSSPEKKHHFELDLPDEIRADQMMEMINAFDISPKKVVRRNSYVVYLKDGDEIADMLSVIEAAASLMTFENMRIVKDIRNSINREVNCETANISKIAGAAVKQIEDIEYIDKSMGRDYLPETLRVIADIRVENPLLSLKEIGEMLDPPIGKSGVNHRLRRISKLADKLRGEA